MLLGFFSMPKTLKKAAEPSPAADRRARLDDEEEFFRNVIGALQQQEHAPKYKRARAVVKDAVDCLPAGQLRDRLGEQLPAMLAQLKQTLASQRHEQPSPPPPSVPWKRTAHQLNTATDAGYLEAAEKCSDEQIPTLILARAPPCESILRRLMPIESPSALTLCRIGNITAALVAASGSVNVAPIVEAALLHARSHLVRLDSEIVSWHASLSSSTLQPTNVSIGNRDAHKECGTLLRHLAAILAARTAIKTSEHSALLSRSCDANAPPPESPHAAMLSLCLVSCAAKMYSVALEGQHTVLLLQVCRSLVAAGLADAEAKLHGIPRETIVDFLANHRAPSTATADQPPMTCRMQPLAWIALHSAMERLSAAPHAQPLSLAELVMQRHCCQLHELMGDVAAGVAVTESLLVRPCGGELLGWLQTQTEVPAASHRCSAVGWNGDPSAAAVQYLVQEITFEDCVALLEGQQRGRGCAESAVPVVVAALNSADLPVASPNDDDNDLYLLDGTAAGNVFDAVWEACSDEGDGDDAGLVSLGNAGDAVADDGSDEADD
jgi:hypothetical protein